MNNSTEDKIKDWEKKFDKKFVLIWDAMEIEYGQGDLAMEKVKKFIKDLVSSAVKEARLSAREEAKEKYEREIIDRKKLVDKTVNHLWGEIKFWSENEWKTRMKHSTEYEARLAGYTNGVISRMVSELQSNKAKKV